MKRAAIYIRVSTEEQAEEGYSLAAQERACRMYAEVQGWHVVQRYADEGLSAFKDRIEDRPQLQALLTAVRSGQIDAVIVHKLDRFFRRVRLLIEVVEEFERRGVAFVSFSEQMDFSTPVGRMILTNLGGFAEFYSRNLSLETAKGKREKAQQGGWVGPIPIGYTKGPDGDLIPSDDAPVVQRIFAAYATRHHSYTSLADELNAEGFQTHDARLGRRGRFGRESIRTILGNRAYIGEVSSGGQSFPGRHQPLVSPELFERVQQIRAERTKEYGSPVRETNAWLTGVIYCSVCGGKLWHQFGSSRGTGRYYRCSGISRRECTERQARADTLEGQMEEIFAALMIPEPLQAEIITTARRLALHHVRPVTTSQPSLDAYDSQLKEAYNAGILTKSEYERKRSERQKAHAAARIAEGFDEQAALSLLNCLPDLLRRATTSERLAVVKSLFERIWVQDRRIVRLTPRSDVGPLLKSVAMVLDGVPDGLSCPHMTLQPPQVFLSWDRSAV